jgi:hypothetical protein
MKNKFDEWIKKFPRECMNDYRVYDIWLKFFEDNKPENFARNMALQFYKFACLFETFEYKNMIHGNGHHIAQSISSIIEYIAYDRFISKNKDNEYKEQLHKKAIEAVKHLLS